MFDSALYLEVTGSYHKQALCVYPEAEMSYISSSFAKELQ